MNGNYILVWDLSSSILMVVVLRQYKEMLNVSSLTILRLGDKQDLLDCLVSK